MGMSGKHPCIRVQEHIHHKSKWTKDKGPWQLIHWEEFLNKCDAWKRERQIKSYKGGRAFKKLLEGSHSLV